VCGRFMLKYVNNFKTILERKLARNSININKTNNYLSPQAIEHSNDLAYEVGNSDSSLGQAKRPVN